MNEKLNDPFIASKPYWSILNHLLNNVKVSSIRPLLVDTVIISDFQKKETENFNKFLPLSVPQ